MTGRHDQIDLPMSTRLPDGKTLLCKQAVRVLPGKRMVCTAELDGMPVYAKLFTTAARRQWEKELQAYHQAAGLSVPELLYSAALDEPQCFVILTRPIADGTSLLEFLQQHDNELPLPVLALLIQNFAALHEAGALHTDPHPGNFLLRDNQLAMLDVAAFDFTDQPPAIDAAMDNLAFLLAQFPAADDDVYMHALELYRQHRSLHATDMDGDRLKSRIRSYLQQRMDSFLKKIWRNSSRYQASRDFSGRSIVRRDMMTDNMRSFIADPDSEMNKAEAVMLKDGNSSTVKQVEIDGRKFIIKRYNIKNPLHALKRAVQPTRAARSWRNANLLSHVGIATAAPVAMIERRFGPLRGKAWFVCEYIEGQTLREYTAGHAADESDRVVMQLGRTVSRLDKFHIAHGDLKATNFLVSADKVYLLDLDGMALIKNKSSFNKAHKADIMRLLANWQAGSEYYRLFQRLLCETKAG